MLKNIISKNRNQLSEAEDNKKYYLFRIQVPILSIDVFLSTVKSLGIKHYQNECTSSIDDIILTCSSVTATYCFLFHSLNKSDGNMVHNNRYISRRRVMLCHSLFTKKKISIYSPLSPMNLQDGSM